MPNSRQTKKTHLPLSARRRKNKGQNLQIWREQKKDDENSNKSTVSDKLVEAVHKQKNDASGPSSSQTVEARPIASTPITNTPVGGSQFASTSYNYEDEFDDSDWLDGIEPLKDTVQNTRNEEVSYKPLAITGRRIVNISHFIQSIQNLELHEPFSCKFSDMDLVKNKRIGLIDELTFQCRMCGKIEKITTDVLSKDKTDMTINTAMVNAITNMGQGYSQMEDLCSYLDMPCMAIATYTKHKQKVNTAVHECSWESMEQAGKEEAAIAISEGRIDEHGIPEITVVVDGAWSKRSYKNNYNALSGVACIIGLRTKKVLYIGIKNSYCCICARAESNRTTVSDHVCYRNWTKTATAMEAEIIAEGFKRSIEMHSLKYVNVIGDGDSSVMSKLNNVQPYGPETTIKKIYCTNHLLRNYVRKIREISEQRRNFLGPVPGELRNVVKTNLLRLRHGVTGAVRYHKEQSLSEQSIYDSVKNLKDDILNGPYHVFGDHSKCKKYFCLGPKEHEENVVERLKAYGLWQEIISANHFLASFTYSLFESYTSNLAESFNAKICKYVGGKRINFVQRNTYTVRCELSALSFNEREDECSRKLHKKIASGKSPGFHSKKIKVRRQRRASNPRRTLFPVTKKRKPLMFGPDKDYGQIQISDIDMDPNEFQKKKSQFLRSLELTASEKINLEINSRGQSQCELWKKERKKRITASNFGRICKMKNSTSCKKIVEQLLYSGFKGNFATNYGHIHEKQAISELEIMLGISVEDCGLFVDSEMPYLAASPDGTFGGKALVEVKCPANAKEMTPHEAVRHKNIKFCVLKGEDLELKRNHNYFYQIQGQLHITGREYCLFVVWTPHGISVEKICKDNQFWEKHMKEQLSTFYYDCLLPEIVDPRYPRGMPIRDRFSKNIV